MARDYYSLPRPPQWQPDRSNEHPLLGNRYGQHEPPQLHDPPPPPSDLSRPLNIGGALREHCRIPAQYYFLSAILDNGEAVTFSGPTEYKEKTPSFFDMNKWRRYATGQAVSGMMEDQDAGFNDYTRSDTRSYSRQSLADFDGRRTMDRRRMTGHDMLDEDLYRRKRVRATTSRRVADLDDMPVQMAQPTKMSVQIQDHQAVWDIYDQRFRSLQQTACKLIAKAWVKLVEPKKQSTHPYTGSDEKAPDWWPKPWGLSREERVRHKEPDHLYKKERVHLLKHILRMVVVPNREQHIDIQKLNLNVAKLEEATNEALSSFFTDKDAPNNARKRPYLKEIFLLARNEEKFKNGEIDGSTSVYVMSDDKIPDNYQSEAEEATPVKDDDEDPMAVPTMSSHRPSLIPPPGGPASALSATVSSTAHGGEHSPASHLPPGPTAQPFMNDLPHRNSHAPYPPPQILHPDIGNDQHSSYVDSNGGISVSGSQSSIGGPHGGMSMHEMFPSQHESSRRPSIFSPTTELPAQSPVYPAWTHSTTAPSTAPLYTFPPHPQAATQHSSFVPQSSVPMPSQNQGYLGSSFDSQPRTSYDTPHDSLFRLSNVSPSSGVNTQGGYPLHMTHHDGRGVSSGLKGEHSSRGHLH